MGRIRVKKTVDNKFSNHIAYSDPLKETVSKENKKKSNIWFDKCNKHEMIVIVLLSNEMVQFFSEKNFHFKIY